jgi:plasmid stability protein
MNLTITVDDEVLRRARIRALEQGTSVNAVLREFLESYAGATTEADARGRLAALARTSDASSGASGRSWTRSDLYDLRVGRDASGDSVHENR